MNKIKCRKCGLVNLASDYDCRRCGHDMGTRFMVSSQRIGPREAAKSSSWIYTLLFIALIGGGAYYIFSGVEKSYDDVQATETNRLNSQANLPANAPRTRTEFEDKQKHNYKTAIQNSQGLAESQKRMEETQKLMQAGQK
ncbi:MAG: hypothetical protein ACKVRN_06655 [Pyrinomonadaceae bacterium]